MLCGAIFWGILTIIINKQTKRFSDLMNLGNSGWKNVNGIRILDVFDKLMNSVNLQKKDIMHHFTNLFDHWWNTFICNLSRSVVHRTNVEKYWNKV